MALVDCIDCKKPISTYAAACPHCGCPLGNSALLKVVKVPKLPPDLNVGTAVFDWNGEGSIRASIVANDSGLEDLSFGEVSIERCDYGLNFITYSPACKFTKIHYSQILKTLLLKNEKVEKKNKSVIGRALIGTILLGPLGAVVGGISGTGTTDVDKSTFDGTIIYWSVEANKYCTLQIGSNNRTTVGFFRKVNEIVLEFSHLHK